MSEKGSEGGIDVGYAAIIASVALILLILGFKWFIEFLKKRRYNNRIAKYKHEVN